MRTFTPIADRIAAILIMSLGILLPFGVAVSFAQEPLQGKVVKVIDGDTYWVSTAQGNIKVRLQNADAYETSRREGLYRQAYLAGISIDSALALGFKGRKFANDVLLGETVELVEEPRDRGKDSHGTRDLYLVKINGQDFGVMLEQVGLAAPWSFKKYRWQHDSSKNK